MLALASLALLVGGLPLARGIITPTSPDSTTVVNVGEDITALWDADATGTWTNVTCQLMTGDNLDMIVLSTLASGIDGTTTTSLSIAAPDVTPNAAIYFLQFSNAGDMTALTWTTRFTIAAADGSTTEPTNSTVYDGNSVAWGTGTLVDSSASDASTNASTDASATALATVTDSVSSVSASPSSSTTSSGITLYNSESASDTLTTSAATAIAVAASVSVSSSTSASASTATASKSTSAAGRLVVSVAGVAGVGGAVGLALAALGGVAML